ncbi:MAG: PilZ domain-containing protein [Candidatus Omnitrophica bacterium]|nr:PilZ domain-containing protein [Candidatus Omnitrophota bacterium]
MIRFIALWLIVVASAILLFILREERLAQQGKIPLGRLRRIWLFSERRRAPRYRLNLSIKYVRLNGDPPSSAQTWDVSQTGASLVMKERLEPGSGLRIEAAAPEGGEPVIFSGRVVWVRPIPPKRQDSTQERLFLTGLQFDRLDAKTDSALGKILPWLIRPEGKSPHA